MASKPKLPKEVFWVERTPPDDERIPYYGRSLNRLYARYSYVTQFIGANKSTKSSSKFKVYKIKGPIEWVEVPQEIEVR